MRRMLGNEQASKVYEGMGRNDKRAKERKQKEGDDEMKEETTKQEKRSHRKD